jgi:hypothetical protein
MHPFDRACAGGPGMGPQGVVPPLEERHQLVQRASAVEAVPSAHVLPL